MMKKVLGIMFVGFFLIGVSPALAEKIYLICQVKATDSKNTGIAKALIPVGPIININYIIIDKKNNKPKINIKEHMPGKLWPSDKPGNVLPDIKGSDRQTKSDYKNEHFFYTVNSKMLEGQMKKTFDIYLNDKWIIEGSEVGVMGENYKFKGICNEGPKKDFLKIRKKGAAKFKDKKIIVNPDFKTFGK